MEFEGTEKKLEILVADDHPPLRSLGRPFWKDIVARSHATILSTISNPDCDAFLLSESSLFVYDRRLIMITCGRTTLIAAALALVDRIGAEAIPSLIYERKNENFPGLQPSTFDEDAATLDQRIPGTALRFGNENGHHVSLFHLDRDFHPDPDDVTLEVLMYGLDPVQAARFAAAPGGATKRIRATGIADLFPGFEIDDHAFQPAGYSLNGLGGSAYYTVHVTPERAGSYASFETNASFAEPDLLRRQVLRVLEMFRPRRFDLLLFQTRMDFSRLDPRFRLEEEEQKRLGCGYDVQFCHFERAPAARRSS